MPDTNEMSGDLYVNYFPVPARDRRFLRYMVPGMLWMMCVASFLWAWAQHSLTPILTPTQSRGRATPENDGGYRR